ncbi:hypothetical protein [Flavobacterium terrigena]|uniref:Uncharacterized protein n=1 Tax=Flavobacterium terrigena TaxID=402734 RepID=A0A1H6V0Y1_9FLAO|nr:hypothetical protein [Flavobacterium terrigena]SEI93902.1 hypothetical protein SAMN05660918_1981 [Flavobacterium terrigena]
MKLITNTNLNGTFIEKYKVYNEENVHIFNIVAEEVETGLETRIVKLTGETELIMIEKKNGNGISFNIDLRSISYEKLINLRILLDFNSKFVDSGSAAANVKLVQNENGLVMKEK